MTDGGCDKFTRRGIVVYLMERLQPTPTGCQDTAAAITALIESARRHRQRRALVLAGEHTWCLAQAEQALRIAGSRQVLRLAADPSDECMWFPQRKALEMLGRESDALVFDAHGGFDPDAFGAATGTVRGGGIVILLCPGLTEWPSLPESKYHSAAPAGHASHAPEGRFVRRMVEILRDDPRLLMLEQDHPPGPARDTPDTSTTTELPPSDPACRTEDQARAVAAVIKVIEGQRRRPAVLISDRGRGKSAALGIAAARLIARGLRHIVITGPRIDAVAPVFEHAGALLGEARVSRAAIHLDEALIEYTAPDALLQSDREADLVLVDEAAAIPTPMLERLLERYPRIAFATTVHGYEGTGRGFAVRFQQVLDRRSRGWRALRLEAPIRWAADDPVERLVFRLLALDSEPAPEPVANDATLGTIMVERLNRDALARDETLLSEIFGLLVLAHYRTRPQDLRRLLDDPGLQVFAARHAGHVVATAVLATEGGLDPATAAAIRDGRRRPQGHMLAEALAAHLGLERAATLRGGRVMRIAVHPGATRRGIGTRLIQSLRPAACEQGLDYLGASFGADPGLLEFWQGCGLQPVRLSVNRGASSGAHSALVLQGLSPEGVALAREARSRMLRQLPDQLTGPLRRVEPALVARMLRGDGDGLAYRPDRQDRLEVVAFVEGRRSFEDILGALRRQTLRDLCDPDTADRLAPVQRDALVIAIAQQHGWTEAAAELGLAGRAQVVELLRDALGALLGTRRDIVD